MSENSKQGESHTDQETGQTNSCANISTAVQLRTAHIINKNTDCHYHVNLYLAALLSEHQH